MIAVRSLCSSGRRHAVYGVQVRGKKSLNFSGEERISSWCAATFLSKETFLSREDESELDWLAKLNLHSAHSPVHALRRMCAK